MPKSFLSWTQLVLNKITMNVFNEWECTRNDENIISFFQRWRTWHSSPSIIFFYWVENGGCWNNGGKWQNQYFTYNFEVLVIYSKFHSTKYVCFNLTKRQKQTFLPPDQTQFTRTMVEMPEKSIIKLSVEREGNLNVCLEHYNKLGLIWFGCNSTGIGETN